MCPTEIKHLTTAAAGLNTSQPRPVAQAVLQGALNGSEMKLRKSKEFAHEKCVMSFYVLGLISTVSAVY